MYTLQIYYGYYGRDCSYYNDPEHKQALKALTGRIAPTYDIMLSLDRPFRAYALAHELAHILLHMQGKPWGTHDEMKVHVLATTYMKPEQLEKDMKDMIEWVTSNEEQE